MLLAVLINYAHFLFGLYSFLNFSVEGAIKYSFEDNTLIVIFLFVRSSSFTFSNSFVYQTGKSFYALKQGEKNTRHRSNKKLNVAQLCRIMIYWWVLTRKKKTLLLCHYAFPLPRLLRFRIFTVAPLFNFHPFMT